MHPPYRGLAFLLSIGSLPLACAEENEDSDTKASGPAGSESGTGSSSSDSGTSTSGGPGPTTPTTGDSEGVSGTTSASDTTGDATTDDSQGFITTASSSGATSEGDTEMLPPVTDPTCIAYAAHIVECFPRYEQYRRYVGYYCQYYKEFGLRRDGQACVDAFEGLYVCLTELPCDEFMNEEMLPCEKEEATVEQDCPNLPEPPDTDTDGDTVGASGESGGSSTG